jgi:hypothetical protein
MAQPDATDLNTAIANARSYALSQFNAAYGKLTTSPLVDPLPSNATDADKRQRAADIAAAQNQLAAGLQQIAHMETLVSEQRGREGYNALTTLMETVRDQAAATYARINAVMNDTTGTTTDQHIRNEELTALASVLEGLAKLAPIAVWQNDPTSAAS